MANENMQCCVGVGDVLCKSVTITCEDIVAAGCIVVDFFRVGEKPMGWVINAMKVDAEMRAITIAG